MKSKILIEKLSKKPRLMMGLSVALTITGSFIAFLGVKLAIIQSSIPKDVKEVLTYSRPETLTIKSEDNVILAEFGSVTHEKLPLTEIPLKIQEAFIAIEDSRFYQHQGVDYRGIARAVGVNLSSQKLAEGGSTITQQLARIAFLDQQRSWERKLKEFIISQKMEDNLTKEQILQQYLNLVYLGSGAYGVADAAWIYFGKSVNELNLSEIATIAGIAPAPSVYSPLQNPDLALKRRNLVLNRMAEMGFITSVEVQEAIATPLILNEKQPKRLERKAPYFIEYIREQLPNYVDDKKLKEGGIVVETTLNYQWQENAEKIINRQVKRYGDWQNFKEGALVAINPRNGQIKVMVGGTDFEQNKFNRVTQAQRQPGSTFKTFVYATAIASGMTPNKSYLDAPYTVDGYQPKNYKDKYKGTYVTISQALTNSLNVVAVQNLIDVGWNPIIKVAEKMGIKSPLQSTYSLALGASEVNLLELTNAYGTLANEGLYQPNYSINRILDMQGEVIYQSNNPPPTAAINKETAHITTWMLQKVVDSGTGIPSQIGRPSAGKTGTSDESRDLWFIGYIPQLVTGVWLGNDDNTPTDSSSSMAAVIWRKFMLEATEGMAIENFPSPPDNLKVTQTTLKVEPIKPKKLSYQKMITSSDSSESIGNNNSETTYKSSRRRRKRRSYENNSELNNNSNDSRRTKRRRKRRETYQQPPVVNQEQSPILEKAPKNVEETISPPLLNKPSKSE